MVLFIMALGKPVPKMFWREIYPSPNNGGKMKIKIPTDKPPKIALS